MLIFLPTVSPLMLTVLMVYRLKQVQSPIILLTWSVCVCVWEWGMGGEAGMCISMRSISVDFL